MFSLPYSPVRRAEELQTGRRPALRTLRQLSRIRTNYLVTPAITVQVKTKHVPLAN